MTSASDWSRIKLLFQTALEKGPDERPAFLRERCGDDEALRAEVQSLLDAHGDAGQFADRPAAEILGFSASFVSEGTQIGAAWDAFLRECQATRRLDASRPPFEHYPRGSLYDARTGVFACELCLPVLA